MLSPHELRLLDIIVDRILPVDDGEAMRAYVRERAAIQPDLYRAGLIVLEAHGLDRFDQVESHPLVALIVQHAIEGYYTSAAGTDEVGFRVTA